MQLPSVRVREKMSCKESAFFFENLAYIPHVRQHHSTSVDQQKLSESNRYITIAQWSTTVISRPYWGCLKEWVKNWESRSDFFLNVPIFSTIHHYFNGSSQKVQIFVIKSVFWQNTYTPSRFMGDICKYSNFFGLFITHSFTNSTHSSDTSYALGRVLAIAIDISIDD